MLDEQTVSRLRDGLRDTLLILEKLGDDCADCGELADLIRLAVGDGQRPGNDAQLKILLDVIGAPPPQPAERPAGRTWKDRPTR